MTTIDPRYRAEPTDSARAGLRDWLALGVLMLPVLLTSIDNTVLSFALPQVSTALHPTGEQLLWLVDIYPLMLAGLLIAMGSIGDRVGRRKLLLIGAVGFGIASVCAAYSPSAETLFASRALLGVFGATLMPSTLSLIRNIFTHREDRRLAVATWASAFAGGAALGPVVGGWLLEHFWWGSVFLINVPIIAIFLVAAVFLLPESRDPRPGRIDLPSIFLSMTAMLPFVVGIKQVAEHGFSDLALLGFSTGIISGVLFVRRQKRLVDPMVDMSLFSDRIFSGAIVANLLSLMGYAGFVFFAAQFLQLVAGLSPMAAATVLLPGLVVTVIAGFAAVRLVRIFPARVLVAGSFGLSASGYAIAAFLGTPTTWTIMVAFTVMGLGIGLAETLTNDLMLSSVPPYKAGAASAISETAYEVGAVLGTAVLGSILTSAYRSHLTVPAVARWGGGDSSFETLGSTVEYAGNYPNMVGEELVRSAHAAFELGVQLTSATAIVVAVAAAVVSWRTLKDA
ncbi:MFS transporter [Aeromicrobium sp. A1-2]|uniref:MFS transporter n=1 Tax=Aeromicrobium sp. A1-2 TaxID=2107713 RepID=UPI000E549D1C|nr:MFS transporter [Aeromicrobium sp. A1-2]AXT86393.1 MFS transporter [Aeromicrobium sp. A1-2]